MSAKSPFVGNINESEGGVGIRVEDMLHEQQRQDVVLVLGGVHAATQPIAALPELGVDLGFLRCHGKLLPRSVGYSGKNRNRRRTISA